MSTKRLQKYLNPGNYLRYARYHLRKKYKKSYAQNGEDILVRFIFNALKIPKPTYIDIGAHEPYRYSNTALLYARGCKGINIEANPVLYKAFLRARPKDTNLNIGIGGTSGVMDFYVMSGAGLSTFSKEEAERMAQEYGFSITKVLPVEVKTVAEVVDERAGGVFPDFLSIDTEGLDETILGSIDFTKYRPKVICVETISFSPTRNGVKNHTLIKWLEGKGYLLIADTYINSMFVDAKLWSSPS